MPVKDVTTSLALTQEVVQKLKSLGFTNLQIMRLTGVRSEGRISNWRLGRRGASAANLARLELALEIAGEIDSELGHGYGRQFFFWPVEGSDEIKAANLLAAADPPDIDQFRGLAANFVKMTRPELLAPLSGEGHADSEPEVLPSTGIPGGDSLIAAGFSVHQMSTLVGMIEVDRMQHFITRVRVNPDRFESRLRFAFAAYEALRKVHGASYARQLMYWPSLHLGFQGKSLARAIGGQLTDSKRWPMAERIKLTSAVMWLNQPANLPFLPKER
jgi:hypothetical protein